MPTRSFQPGKSTSGKSTKRFILLIPGMGMIPSGTPTGIPIAGIALTGKSFLPLCLVGQNPDQSDRGSRIVRRGSITG